MLLFIMVSVTSIYDFAEGLYADCLIVMLIVVMLIDVAPSTAVS